MIVKDNMRLELVSFEDLMEEVERRCSVFIASYYLNGYEDEYWTVCGGGDYKSEVFLSRMLMLSIENKCGME